MQISRILILYNRFRRRFFSDPVPARVITFVGLVLFLAVAWFFLQRPAVRILENFKLVTGDPLPQTSGRTNLIILGTGGDGHEGPDLADTIIFVSINLDTGKAVLISIPRDVWVASLRAKINTAYHYGYQKQATSGGLLLAKSAVSESIGQPVHFAVKLDFSSFVTAIDILGGIDIDVEHEFTDDKYPVPGKENDLCDGDPDTRCRYEIVHFSAGTQHMDGASALKFVRSRQSADPGEGTDFARGKRQEKVISAIRSKILSVKNLRNSRVYQDLYELARRSVVTDITPRYYSTFFQLGLKMRKTPLSTHTIEDYLENPEITVKYDSQWVLVPKNNDSQGLYAYVASLLD